MSHVSIYIYSTLSSTPFSLPWPCQVSFALAGHIVAGGVNDIHRTQSPLQDLTGYLQRISGVVRSLSYPERTLSTWVRGDHGHPKFTKEKGRGLGGS